MLIKHTVLEGSVCSLQGVDSRVSSVRWFFGDVACDYCLLWLKLIPVGCRKLKTLGVNAEGGVPDGMCLDHEGRIWTALCGGSAVVCIDPQSGDELHR